MVSSSLPLSASSLPPCSVITAPRLSSQAFVSRIIFKTIVSHHKEYGYDDMVCIVSQPALGSRSSRAGDRAAEHRVEDTQVRSSCQTMSRPTGWRLHSPSPRSVLVCIFPTGFVCTPKLRAFTLLPTLCEDTQTFTVECVLLKCLLTCPTDEILMQQDQPRALCLLSQ